jgi:hypothetical protein
LNAPVIHEQLGDEPLVVAGDSRVFQGCLEQRVQHVEASLVSGEPGAPLLHSAKGAHCNVSIRLPAPWTTPVFQLEQLAWSLLDEGFDSILVAQPVTSGDGVVGVFIEAVVCLDDPGGAALCGNGVTAHGVDLGNDSDAELGMHFHRCDGSA